jgi:RHS repeat-associated protein
VETGLDYFVHRYYSSVQGRFTSVDPLMLRTSIFNPQRWDRYPYVLNNPLKYIDPIGLQNKDPEVNKDAKRPRRVTDERGRQHEMVLVKITPWNGPSMRGRTSVFVRGGGGGDHDAARFIRVQGETEPPEEAPVETEAEREGEEFARERMEAGEPLDLETGSDLIDEVDRMLGRTGKNRVGNENSPSSRRDSKWKQ